MSEQYYGSILQGIADAVGKIVGVQVHLGEAEATTRSTEQGIYWIQPTQDRYRYFEARQTPERSDGAQTGQSQYDRYCSIECTIRDLTQQGSLDLSDRFIAAMTEALGPPGNGNDGQAWWIDGPSDGESSGQNNSPWVELMRLRVRTRAIVQRYPAGNPLVVKATEGIYVSGPKPGQDEELVP